MNHPFKWWCCRYLLRVIFVRDNKDSREQTKSSDYCPPVQGSEIQAGKTQYDLRKGRLRELPSEARTAADRLALSDRGYVASIDGLKTRAERRLNRPRLLSLVSAEQRQRLGCPDLGLLTQEGKIATSHNFGARR